MALFEAAYKNTAGHEGGWTVDQGGQTYKGISRKGWPAWPGWIVIDRYIKANGSPAKKSFFKGKLGEQLDTMILAFYKKNYWDLIQGDYIRNQVLANFIYDFAVNSNGAVRMINDAIGARGTRGITEDGLQKLNNNTGWAYMQIYNARKENFERLGQMKKYKNAKRGWMARLEKFPRPESLTAAA